MVRKTKRIKEFSERFKDLCIELGNERNAKMSELVLAFADCFANAIKEFNKQDLEYHKNNNKKKL